MKKKATISFLMFLLAFCAIAPSVRSQEAGRWDSASFAGFTPIDWHATSVVNDKIYVMAGYDANGLNTALYVYDPATDTWTSPSTTGSYTPRYSTSSCVLDGKIYLIGGCSGPEQSANMVTTVDIFDPSTNTWSSPETSGTFTGRDNLTLSVINGKIYAVGGYNDNGDVNTFEVFDPATNTWSTPKTTGTFTPRGAHSAQVIDNKIYLVGGLNYPSFLSTVQVFDPATNAWSTPKINGTVKATNRILFTSALVDGKIYVIGGTNANDFITPLTTNVIQVYDPVASTWTTLKPGGNKFVPRCYLSTTSGVVGGKIYVMGGQDAKYVYAYNDVFTPPAAGVNDDNAVATQDVEIAPNPTSGSVTLFNASPGAHVTIENILGETVMEMRNTQTSDATLDLSKLPAGTYFARIATGNSVVIKKIVRE